MVYQIDTDETKRIIGENVLALREQSKRSVIDLTGEISMARGYWYEIEQGSANVTIETLEQVAKLFDVTVAYLCTVRTRKRA